MFVAEAVGVKDSSMSVNNNNMEELYSKLTHYCLFLTKTKWDAEDLAQDTWVKAMMACKWSGHSNTEAFLFRIAKNTWIDQARRKNVMARIVDMEFPRLSTEQSFAETSGEIEIAFQLLFKYLSPLQRAVFLIRDVLGFSIQETAGLLTMTEGAVKAALHRARHSLTLLRVNFDREAAHSLPIEEDLKALLRSLSSAYESGDITSLITLLTQADVEPAVAIGLVQNQRLQRITRAGKNAPPRIESLPPLRMTA